MGNISFKSKYQCCVSDSIFYENDETLEESTMEQNNDEILVRKKEFITVESFHTVIH